MLYIRDNQSKINDKPLYFAEIYDYDKANTNVVFDEFKIIEKDNTYLIIGKVNNIDKFNAKNVNNYNEAGEFIYIVIHKEPYKQYNAISKQYNERSLDSFEIAIGLLIKYQQLNLNQIYSGSILISEISHALSLKHFPEIVDKALPKILENFKISSVVDPKFLKNEKIVFTSQNQNKVKSITQLYLEREAYILSKFQEIKSYLNLNANNLTELFFEYLQKDDTTKYVIEKYLQWLTLIIK